MRYLALAADYDWTLARDGRVDDGTVAALERLRATSRKLILVTGRVLDDLLAIFPRIDLFDLVVAENGGVLFDPQARSTELLAEAPPARFVETLHARGVAPVAVGRTIVATWMPNEVAVLEAIRDLGLELHLIFNKGAVMVCSTGITKASGLAAALDRLRLSPRNSGPWATRRNDHSMLRFAEYGAAVTSAVPLLKEAADLVLARGPRRRCDGLVDRLVDDDLATHPRCVARSCSARAPLGRGTSPCFRPE
jgi:HAD superfamily hydrolase (TIGR01484 family)